MTWSKVGKFFAAATTLLALQLHSSNAQVISDEEQVQLHKANLRRALLISNVTFYREIIPEAAKPLLTNDEIQAIHKENELTAVIHIGPMKTGSSSIQASFHAVIGKPDEADGYEDASMAMKSRDMGVWNLVGCFRDPNAPADGFIVCKPEALSEVHQVAARGHNLVVSAEYLTSPDTNLAALKDYLKPWEQHKVVAYYRRYYDWLNSFHNQGNKNIQPPNRHSLADFLNKERKNHFWWNKMYIVESLKRWSEHFPAFEVFNIYEIPDGDVRESFFCRALPKALKACSKFRLKKALAASTNVAPSVNPSASFVYEGLAFFAKEMGLWKEETGGQTLKEVAFKARDHQEKDLKLTAYDFGTAMECPDEETAKYLLDKTLESEQQLFPKYFAAKGEKEIREDFAKQIKTKLCHVDAKAVLEGSPEWRKFFASLKNDAPTP